MTAVWTILVHYFSSLLNKTQTHSFHPSSIPMPRLLVDPNLAEPPNFNTGVLAYARDAVVARDNITPEAAILILTELWTADNDARKLTWKQQLAEDREAAQAADLAQQEEAQRLREERKTEEREERREWDKKRPKLNPVTPNKPIPTSIIARPSRFALHKLEEYEYVELLHPRRMRRSFEE